VFIIVVVVWAVFEAVMRVIQRLRATDPPNDPSFFVLVPCIAARSSRRRYSAAAAGCSGLAA